MGQGHGSLGDRRSRATDGRAGGERDGATGTDVRTEPGTVRAVRLFRAAGDAGGAFRSGKPVPDRDLGNADANVHRLDAFVLVRVVHVESRDLGSGGVHDVRAAGGVADRGSSPWRVGPAANGLCLRAGDAGRRTKADARDQGLGFAGQGGEMRPDWIRDAGRVILVAMVAACAKPGAPRPAPTPASPAPVVAPPSSVATPPPVVEETEISGRLPARLSD